MDGNILESNTEPQWVSACCKEELLLWDNLKQDFVETGL
jgi:hypothetical protein